MHEKALPPASRKLLARLTREGDAALAGWTLAGGTGLALSLGHRLSDDFDFFRNQDMRARDLQGILSAVASCETLQLTDRTLTVLLAGVKLSFFQIPEPFLYQSAPYAFFRVADPRDIALMKLLAITNRGSRKDFVDLFTILRDGPSLRDYLALLPARYGEQRLNDLQVLTSLTYFEDAEAEPLPRMLEPFDWDECRAFFVREAAGIVLPTGRAGTLRRPRPRRPRGG
jgi:hypothetical protein